MEIRIAIINKSKIFREGLSRILSEYEGFEVWGEFKDGLSCLNELKQTKSIFPHVILSDAESVALDEDNTGEWIKKSKKRIRIVVIEERGNDMLKEDVVKKGIKGYLHTSCDLGELLQAIRSARNNNYYFNELVSEDEWFRIQKQQPKKRESPQYSGVIFTKREREVVELICKEYTYSAIAKKLKISQRTVESHKEKILLKAGVKKVTGLVYYAAKHNLV